MDKQDYPMMIYHIVEGNKVIKNELELKLWQDKGWTKNYNSFCVVTTTQKKIDWHKSEIAKLEKILHNVDYKVNDQENVSRETLSKIEPLDEPKKTVVEPVKKERGRPRKS